MHQGETIPGGEPSYTPDDANKELCYLHLDVPHMRAVAKAYQFPDAEILHGRPIQKGQVKVQVTEVLNDEHMTPVPISDPEVTHIANAIGTFIAWPKQLVLDTPHEPSSPVEKVIKLSITCVYTLLFVHVYTE